MTADDLGRLARDVEQLAVRIRDLENVSTPYPKQLLEEFRDLQRRVNDMDRAGTIISRRRLETVEAELHEVKAAAATREALNVVAEDVKDVKEEAKAMRFSVRSATIAGVASLAASLIFWVLTKGNG